MTIRHRAKNETPTGLTTEKLVGGLAIVGIGLAAIYESTNYPLGTIRSIGPGYFPLGLGIIVVLLGAAFLWEARSTPREGNRIALRGLISVAAAMAAFGLLIEKAGAIAAIAALVALAGLAEPQYKPIPTAIVAAILCSFLVVIKWLVGPSLTIDLF